jgi:hypothetical protein
MTVVYPAPVPLPTRPARVFSGSTEPLAHFLQHG